MTTVGPRWLREQITALSPAKWGARIMPFRHVDTSAFGPEDLKILHDVFDLSWQRLLAEGLNGSDDQLEAARRRLAKCIMANATPGNLDVKLLFERCLDFFRQPLGPEGQASYAASLTNFCLKRPSSGDNAPTK